MIEKELYFTSVVTIRVSTMIESNHPLNHDLRDFNHFPASFQAVQIPSRLTYLDCLA